MPGLPGQKGEAVRVEVCKLIFSIIKKRSVYNRL
jgi:hypothetical protein